MSMNEYFLECVICFMTGLDQKERNFCDINTLLEAPQVDIFTNQTF